MAESVIRQSELRNNNAEVMRRVAAGESFVVTVHGRPVADLVPHQRRRGGASASLADLREALTGLGVVADEGWRADLERSAWADDSDDSDDPHEDPWARAR